MAASSESPNPFEAYQGEEVETAPVKAARHAEQEPVSMIAIAILLFIGALLAFIAWRHKSP